MFTLTTTLHRDIPHIWGEIEGQNIDVAIWLRREGDSADGESILYWSQTIRYALKKGRHSFSSSVISIIHYIVIIEIELMNFSIEFLVYYSLFAIFLLNLISIGC